MSEKQEWGRHKSRNGADIKAGTEKHKSRNGASEKQEWGDIKAETGQ